MFNRFRRSSFLFFVLAAAAFAQSESQIESDEVKRVGVHLNCQCGCKDNLNCNMSSGQCHFCKPARTKIFDMEQAGMSDGAIIQAFVKEYGEKIFRPDPNSFFWVIPYAALALGGLIVWAVLRRIRGHRPLQPALAGGPPGLLAQDDDPTLARYRDAIEKDIARLD